VLERGEVANSWRRERWDSLRLLTPNWHTRLPGLDYAGDDPDGFMTAPEVADHLAGQGYEVVVTGTPDERDLVGRVVGAARAPVRSLVGSLSLGGLIGCYHDCRVVVANDTGPVHVAAAVGTPTVGIFWVGNLINCAVPLRARHRPIASWTIHCPECGTDCSRDIYPARAGAGTCPHRSSFVTDVPVVEVLEAVTDLLDTTETAGPVTTGTAARVR